MLDTQIEVLDSHDLKELPAAGHLTTVVVSVPPNNPGTPAHRHSGPVYGYMLEARRHLRHPGPVVDPRAKG